MDYAYSPEGALTRINDPGLRGEAADLWGFALATTCGFRAPDYNGNLAGQRWRSCADTVERAYGYFRDCANRNAAGTRRNASPQTLV